MELIRSQQTLTVVSNQQMMSMKTGLRPVLISNLLIPSCTLKRLRSTQSTIL